MSSHFVDWNKINDENSSEQENESDDQPYQFRGSQKQLKAQIKQQKTVLRKDLQQPLSPRSTKFNNKKKVAEIIQQQLAKIESDKKDKIWLYVQYEQTEKFQEINAVLNELKQIQKINHLRQNKGWNILLKKQDARTFVREGIKQQRGWCKFKYSTLNQLQQDYYYKNSQFGYSYGTAKKKFVEKSQKNIRQLIQDGSKKQQKVSNQQGSQQIMSQSTQSNKLQNFKVKTKQKSEYQEKRYYDQGKKKKYVAKQSYPLDQPDLMTKKTVSLSSNLPQNKKDDYSSQQKQEKPQIVQSKSQNKLQNISQNKQQNKSQNKSQKKSDQENADKQIQSPSKKKRKKKNKNKDKDKNKNKQVVTSNNPFNSLKTY